MRKFFSLMQQGIIATVLVCFFTMTPLVAMAGFSDRSVSGVYKVVQMAAVTATYSDGEFVGTSGTINDCSFFYIRPYDLDATLDLIVQAGANSYTATYSFKIEAATANINTEFGPFYMDETDTSINYYVALTTNAAPAASCSVYVRSYRPAKHNY